MFILIACNYQHKAATYPRSVSEIQSNRGIESSVYYFKFFVTIEKPDAPRNVRILDSTPVSIQITWDDSFNGNLPVLRYLVNIDNRQENATSSPYNITGLTMNVIYNITVQAVNSEGQSEKSKLIREQISESGKFLGNNLRIICSFKFLQDVFDIPA